MPQEAREVQDVLDRLVRDGLEVGVQVAAYLDGELVVDAWAGVPDKVTGRPVDGETLFTTFSISKGITSTCIHILADRGLVDYDVSIATYWPEFGTRGKGSATVRHALTHKVGIPQDPPEFSLTEGLSWDAVCRATAEMTPLWEPGTRTGYHPLTFGWILGEVLRRVDGRPIDQFLQDEICRPLRIDGLYFGVPGELEQRVATLENAHTVSQLDLSQNPSLLDVADAMNRPQVRRAVVPGAGAIGNARSVARLYAMLAGGGELDGTRILARDRVATLSEPEPEDVDSAGVRWWTAHSLGYTLGGGPGPREGHPQAFGYEGVGTIGFADPGRNYAFAFLKNRLDLSETEMDSATLVARTVEQALGIAR